jgi:hydrogenase maturation protein HypF
MTSANPHGEPIVRDEAEARQRLGGIADAVLGHDRAIVAVCDDSVLRPLAGGIFLRRSRGYHTTAVTLPQRRPSVLACGAWLKNTVAASRGDEVFLSPHIGSLDNAATCRFFDATVTRLIDFLAVRPRRIAHDLHPDFYSSRAALALSARFDAPTLAVAHHHAHIAAVCAEHAVTEPVLGLALDGVGLGPDGSAWGGELLRVAGAHCERLGHLRPLPLPGGDRAAREPWRLALAALFVAGRRDEARQRFADEAATPTLLTMLERSIHCPPTTSLGRLFAAAAALLGLIRREDYEAQAAILLEQEAVRWIARNGWPQVSDRWQITADGVLDLLPLLLELHTVGERSLAAAVFHASLIAALTGWALRAVQSTAITTVAAGGGCLANVLLAEGLAQALARQGVRFLRPQRLPPGDGGIALGQLWVAWQGAF